MIAVEAGQRPGAAIVGVHAEPLEMALRTIELCNRFHRPVMVDDGETVRIARPDMPPMQEKAFNMACLLLGRYFSSFVKEE